MNPGDLRGRADADAEEHVAGDRMTGAVEDHAVAAIGRVKLAAGEHAAAGAAVGDHHGHARAAADEMTAAVSGQPRAGVINHSAASGPAVLEGTAGKQVLVARLHLHRQASPASRIPAVPEQAVLDRVVVSVVPGAVLVEADTDRKSTRLNSSHLGISYAVVCL